MERERETDTHKQGGEGQAEDQISTHINMPRKNPCAVHI